MPWGHIKQYGFIMCEKWKDCIVYYCQSLSLAHNHTKLTSVSVHNEHIFYSTGTVLTALNFFFSRNLLIGQIS
jgi:hypothetical protein